MKQGQVPKAAGEAELGSPLHGLDDEESRRNFMKSTYTRANEQVSSARWQDWTCLLCVHCFIHSCNGEGRLAN